MLFKLHNQTCMNSSISFLTLFQSCQNGRRRTRGRTTLPELYNLPLEERVKVSRNNIGQPIGSEAVLPINYPSWHEMLNDNKNQTLDLIKAKFYLEVSDDYLKQALGKNGDTTRARERIGVASRQKLKFTHIAGSKSFARIANEPEVTSGSNVGRIQLFDITQTKKDGSPIISEAAEIMEKLKENRTEYGTTTSTAGSAINMNDIDNQVIAQIFGPERYGRVRDTGSFVTPTKYFESSSSQYMPSQNHSVHAQVDRVRQELQQDMDAKIAAVQAEAVTSEATLQAKYDDVRTQLANIMKMLKKNPPQDPPS
ncbi:hypothetical protein GQ457_01G011320 [Hibiscus cannabinus]